MLRKCARDSWSKQFDCEERRTTLRRPRARQLTVSGRREADAAGSAEAVDYRLRHFPLLVEGKAQHLLQQSINAWRHFLRSPLG